MQRLSGYLPFVSVYAVLVGTLYLWGYWSAFDINILQYIGLVEIAKSAAFPLASTFGAMALGALIGRLLPVDPLPARPDTAPERFVRKHARLLTALYVAALASLLISNIPGKWLMATVPAFPLVVFALMRRGVLSDLIPDWKTRFSVVTLLTLLVIGAYGVGRGRADGMIEGRDYFLVDQASVEHVPGLRTTRTGELRYLGHAGDYVFLLSPDSSIQIVRAEAIPAIVVRHQRSLVKD